MTSNTSFFKLLKFELKSHGYMLALMGFLCALLYPVNYQLQLERAVNMVSYESSNGVVELIKSQKYIAATDTLGSGSFMTTAFLTVAAVLCALSFFSYLHSRESVDFFHSVPVTRNTLFTVNYTAGIVTALLPYTVCLMIALFAVGGANDAVNPETVHNVLRAFGFFCFAYVSIYTLCVLAMLLTGRYITGMLGMAVLCAYGPVCITLVQWLVVKFFSTFYVPNSDGSIAFYFSPVTLLMKIQGEANIRMANPISSLALLAFALGGFALCILTYNKRASEAAENAISFTALESVIKVAVCIPSALIIGYISEYFTGYVRASWFAVISVLAAFFINGAIEFIYSADIRNILRHKFSSLAAVGGTALVIVLLVFDPIGYDSYLPARDDVRAMSLYSYSMTDPLVEYSSVKEDEEFFLKNGEISDCDAIYELAEAGVANATGAANLTANGSGSSYGSGAHAVAGDDNTNITVCYYLKNGSRAYRTYYVSTALLNEKLDTLSQNSEFRAKYYPSSFGDVTDADSASAVNWAGFGSGAQSLDLSAQELDELKALYIEETNALSLADVRAESPMMTLNFQKHIDVVTANYSYYNYKAAPEALTESWCFIYPQHEKTLAFLREHGVKEGIPKGEEIADIRISVQGIPGQNIYNHASLNAESYSYGNVDYKSYALHSPEDIDALLSSVKRCRYDAELSSPEVYLYISYSDGGYADCRCEITDSKTFSEIINTKAIAEF